jgi:hypothetical protein
MFYPKLLKGMSDNNNQRLESLVSKTMYTFSNSSLHYIFSEYPSFHVIIALAIAKKREIFDLERFQFDLREKKNAKRSK